MSAPDAATVAAVLAMHRHPGEVLHIFGEAWMVCGCGERIDLPVREGKLSHAEAAGLFEAHQAAALLASEPIAQALAAVEAVARVEALADEWERHTDAIAITYQDADRRRQVTAGQRRNIADIRAALRPEGGNQ